MQQAASFPGVVGHGQTRHMLHTALTRGRLHHALLMHGPRGVGKATLARGLACALICPEVLPGSVVDVKSVWHFGFMGG